MKTARDYSDNGLVLTRFFITSIPNECHSLVGNICALNSPGPGVKSWSADWLNGEEICVLS
jgi:hypothetical protein